MKQWKQWLGLINSLILTVWIIFFPDTEPLSQTLEKGNGRTGFFNESHPFYFFYCCLFLIGTLIQVWLIFLGKKRNNKDE